MVMVDAGYPIMCNKPSSVIPSIGKEPTVIQQVVVMILLYRICLHFISRVLKVIQKWAPILSYRFISVAVVFHQQWRFKLLQRSPPYQVRSLGFRKLSLPNPTLCWAKISPPTCVQIFDLVLRIHVSCDLFVLSCQGYDLFPLQKRLVFVSVSLNSPCVWSAKDVHQLKMPFVRYQYLICNCRSFYCNLSWQYHEIFMYSISTIVNLGHQQTSC